MPAEPAGGPGVHPSTTENKQPPRTASGCFPGPAWSWDLCTCHSPPLEHVPSPSTASSASHSYAFGGPQLRHCPLRRPCLSIPSHSPGLGQVQLCCLNTVHPSPSQQGWGCLSVCLSVCLPWILGSVRTGTTSYQMRCG